MKRNPESQHRKDAFQTTLKQWVSVQGIGLHSGQPVEMWLGPAPAGTGYVFDRIDLPGRPSVRAVPENVCESALCTVLEADGVRVSTVEHLLGTCYGLGIDNLRVVLDAEEVPILDGSARPLVKLIREAGIFRLGVGRTRLKLIKPLAVVDGDRYFKVFPARQLSIDCTLDFDHPLISDQRWRFSIDQLDFEDDIAPARTFGFLKDVGEMKRAGLIQGGSLDNAVVIDAFSVLNPGGLRFPDEFVRHKSLDILGDLAILGAPLAARVVAYKSGHSLHRALVRQLVDGSPYLERVQPAAAEVATAQVALPFDRPAFGLPRLQSA